MANLKELLNSSGNASVTYRFDFSSSTIALLVSALNERVGSLLDRRKLLLEYPDNVFSPGEFYGYDVGCIDEEISEIRGLIAILYNVRGSRDPKGGAAYEK